MTPNFCKNRLPDHTDFYTCGNVTLPNNTHCLACRPEKLMDAQHWAAVHALEKRFLDYALAKYPEENPTSAYCNVEGDGIIHTDHGCRIISRVDIDAASL